MTQLIQCRDCKTIFTSYVWINVYECPVCKSTNTAVVCNLYDPPLTFGVTDSNPFIAPSKDLTPVE